MAVYKRGKTGIYWYRFAWKGKVVRETTRQGNRRVAEQIEAAHKAALAKSEVGIRDKKTAPTLAEFVESDLLPHVRVRFAEKHTTRYYYEVQTRHLIAYKPLADAALDAITPESISGFAAKAKDSGYQVASINRALQVLRRVLRLAVEWGKVEKVPPRVSLLPGERRRERVLTLSEESAYLEAARAVGEGILADYQSALEGIRATLRGEVPIKPHDPFLLRDVATILLDCGLRPEECYRLRWEHARDGALLIPFGKTANARRSIPLANRAASVLEMRKASISSEWIFPAPTKSGHIESSSLKKQHAKACQLAQLERVPFYTFRHTCLTRWSRHMDPYTLAYFAGHSDFSTTRRYVHPNLEAGREAMERAHRAQIPPGPLIPNQSPNTNAVEVGTGLQ